MNYYNEFDQNAAAWLRELIKMGAIPAGDVDERSISDVCSNDLKGYTQCHFFAGIGGWSLALQRAGIASDRPLWTGSCPCQDFSCAGKGKGVGSHRDLWPDFFRLIRERRPERVFGEQVEAAIGHGWLDRLSSDMEAEGYAVGSVVLGAHSAGADHQRQRLYWVADAQPCGRKPQLRRVPDGIQHEAIEQKKCVLPIGGCGASESCRMGDTEGERPQGRTGDGRGLAQEGQREPAERHAGLSGVSRNFWSDAIPHLCKDGKLRRFEPRVFKMASVISCRMGHCRDQGIQNAQEKENYLLNESAEPCTITGFNTTKEFDYAAPIAPNTGEVLSVLRKEDGTKTLPFGNAGSRISLQAQEVLRTALHGDVDGRSSQKAEPEEQQAAVCEMQNAAMRELRDTSKIGRSPQRLESREQRPCEFDDFVLALSHADPLARMEEDEKTTKVLSYLWRACEETHDVPKTFPTLEEAWRSLSREKKLSVWLRFGEGRFIVTQTKILEGQIFPLVAKLPRGMVPSSRIGFPIDADQTGEARVMRLKGYGNAICVDTAVMFIEECENIFCGANPTMKGAQK